MIINLVLEVAQSYLALRNLYVPQIYSIMNQGVASKTLTTVSLHPHVE